MITKLTDGIISAIKAEFGDGHEVYQESIKQHLTEPCFLVTCVSSQNDLYLGSTYKKNNLFMVQYFPADKNEPRAECADVAERLFLCLEYINADGLKRGTAMDAEVVDDVLHFQVNYDFLIRKINPDEIKMESIDTDVGVKGD